MFVCHIGVTAHKDIIVGILMKVYVYMCKPLWR